MVPIEHFMLMALQLLKTHRTIWRVQICGRIGVKSVKVKDKSFGGSEYKREFIIKSINNSQK
jgi:hypothetical protein